MALSGCVTNREYIVDSDYSYGGNFKRYKTFDFIRNVNQDTLHNHDLVKQTMTNRLGAQGYSKTEEKPDLLIMYAIYYDDFYLRGYNQRTIESWVGGDQALIKTKRKENTPTFIEDEEYFEEEDLEKGEYQETKYCMHEGTMFVLFFDRKRKRTVWQGYASGVFSRDDSQADRNIKAATAKIFNEYRLLANGYLLKG